MMDGVIRAEKASPETRVADGEGACWFSDPADDVEVVAAPDSMLVVD